MSFIDEVTGLFVDLCCCRVECQAEVALDRGHRRTHFVGCGANEFRLLAFVALLECDIAEHHDNTGTRLPYWRHDDRHEDFFAGVGYEAEIVGADFFIGGKRL